MIDGPSKTLLPDGLRDVLQPEATREEKVTQGLIDRFRQFAYRRVDPPLVEFEDSLLDGAGAATTHHTFRLMDPVTQRMMGVRADMTVQVARIATSRLAKAERPLRLCYAGPVLRVRGTQLRPDRQVTQAGCELIGSSAPEADAELITVAVEALHQVGAHHLSIDISLPTVVSEVCHVLGLDNTQKHAVRAALDRKDAYAVSQLGGEAAVQLGALLAATGPVDQALPKLMALDLPQSAAGQRDQLMKVIALLKTSAPELDITVDPVECRGFEYQTGLSFTLFAKGERGELGRGGRYLAGDAKEPATGFSLYLDTVLRAVPQAREIETLYLPYGSEPKRIALLQASGWCVLTGLSKEQDIEAEARRLGCTHIDDDTAGTAPRRLE